MTKIAVTTGDPDGIGPWITVKALRHFKKSNSVFVVFRDSSSHHLFESLSSTFHRVIISDPADLHDLPLKKNCLIEVVSQSTCQDWVFAAAKLCKNKTLDGLVTGPMSKFKRKKIVYGHTEILSEVCGGATLYQAYLGNLFNVVLLTAHLPLARVSDELKILLKSGRFKKFIQIVGESFHTSSRRPLALLGLNPHAGEGGLLGAEELLIRRQMRSVNCPLQMNLSPDSAFLKKNWSKFSAFIALYHDQGLIPFKAVHGTQGCQWTLGLPFVRTSVDHGTAKDLRNKSFADHESMVHAIKQCEFLIQKGRPYVR